MSFQIIEQPGTIAGRIGKGLAAGLSEQLPKEIGRQRLAAGLKGLEGKNLTPLQQAAELYKSGATAEDVNQLLPIVQQSGKREAFQKRFGGKEAEGEKKTQAPIKEAAKEIVPSKPSIGKLTPEETRSYKSKLLQEPTFREVGELANEYLSSGQATNESEATAKAQVELTQDKIAQEKQLGKLKADLNERVARQLQNTGLNDFKDVAGEIQQALLERGEFNVLEKGMTPEESSANISDILTSLGKAATNTKATGSISNWAQSAAEKKRAILEQKKEFEDLGFGELFDDVAAGALGITPLKAASILDPLKNEKIKKDIKSLSKGVPGGRFRDIDEKKLDKIVGEINGNDNILSIGLELRDKRYNVNQFLNKVREFADKGKIKLTDQQERQLKKPVRNSIYGDIWFSAR